jgi:hypothetical protein
MKCQARGALAFISGETGKLILGRVACEQKGWASVTWEIESGETPLLL